MVFIGSVDVDIPAGVRPWAATREDRLRRERHAAQLVGDAIVAVRYFHTDSNPPDRPPGMRTRVVREAAKPWRFAGFDAVGHGVELDTRAGHTFSSTWAIDREHVGLSFRREPLRPRWLSGHSFVVVYDAHDRWAELLDTRVEEVRLHWWAQKPPGEADGCHTVSLRIGEHSLRLVLGEAGPDDRLEPADDGVAVVFDEA